MTRGEALELLGLLPDATAGQAERAYEDQFNDFRIRIDNAPTPALRTRLQAGLQRLEEARDTLLGARPAEAYESLPWSERGAAPPQGHANGGAHGSAHGSAHASAPRDGGAGGSATVIVRSARWCRLIVDGEPAGAIQPDARLRLELLPGVHELKAVGVNGEEWNAEIRLPAGEQTIATVAWAASAADREATTAQSAGAQRDTRRRRRLMTLGLAAAVVVLAAAWFLNYQAARMQREATFRQAMADLPQRRLEALRDSASAGHAGAQTRLGTVYHTGDGVDADHAEAMRLYKLAASQGDASAENNIGVLYFDGAGVGQDAGEAMRWFRRAAGKDLPEAHYWIGQLYEQGAGVRRDDVEALRHYRAAAARGLGVAQAAIGSFYQSGRGIARDYAQALHWYRLAADQGEAAGQGGLGALYFYGYGVPRDEAEARRWLQLAAGQGHLDAMWRLGVLHELAGDTSSAVVWYREAGDRGHETAAANAERLAPGGTTP